VVASQANPSWLQGKRSRTGTVRFGQGRSRLSLLRASVAGEPN